jgi:hypothetical protein
MAVDQDNTSLLEVFCYEEADAKYYCGTKAEFVSSGKFKSEWFPGVKGNNKTSMTIEGDELLSLGYDPLIAQLKIDRSEEGQGLFDVQMSFTDEEAQRREQIKKKELEELAYKEASALAKGWNDGLPTSVEGFKKHSAWLINEMMTIHFNEGTGSKRGGYSFDKKTVREFDLAVEALCNILINGEVKFNKFMHEQRQRDHATDAFNRGVCLSFTGHERDALIQRFMNELNERAASADVSTAHA